jgi:hypothetical protein
MMSLGLALALLAPPQDLPAALKKKIDAARAAVEKAPEDAKANLELGKLLCFDAGDWAAGLPHLAKGGDEIFAPVAEKDLAGGNHLERVDVGDMWLQVGKKQKPVAAACTSRALSLYSEAWPKLDDTWRGKLRERVAALQRKGPEAKQLGAFPGIWTNPATPKTRCGLDREYAKSGAASLKMLAPDPALQGFQAWISTDEIPIKPGDKVVFSAWVLTQGDEAFSGKLQVKFRGKANTADNHLLLVPVRVDGDMPIWTKVQGEATAPEGSITVDLSFNRSTAKAGVAWIDDMSLKLGDRELVKNGGFEGR